MNDSALRLSGAASSSAPLFPAIDYEQHPAYAEFSAASVRDNQNARELLSQIDAALGALCRPDRTVSQRSIEATFCAEIDPLIRALLGLSEHCVEDTVLERAALRRAADPFRATLLDYAVYAGRRRRRIAPRSSSARSRLIASAMNEAGVYAFAADPDRVRALATLTKPLQDEATLRRSRAPGLRCQVGVPRGGPLWSAVVSLIRDTELLRGLSEYDQHRLRVAWVALERSDSAQRWWHSPHATTELATTRCAYFHNDHSHRTLKSILYLGDVGPENGAFGFLPGSHRWTRSTAGSLFVKALDQGRFATWAEGHPEDRSSYRPHLRDPEVRRGFMRLPSPLRATSHFGDDVLDGSVLSERLLSAERVYRSEVANCISFDGDRGIHRGALVRRGERWALQIGYEEARFEPRRAGHRAKKWLRRRLRGV